MKLPLKLIIKVTCFLLFCSGLNLVYGQDLPSTERTQEDTLKVIVPIDSAVLMLPEIIPEESKPSQPVKAAIAPEPKAFSGIEIGFDYPKLAGLFVSFESKYEGAVALEFLNKFSINIEGGSSVLSPERAYKNGTYESKGNYGRIGLNYIVSFDDNTALFFGGRFGMSRFSEKALFEVLNSLGFSETYELQRDGLQAQWYELILGTETAFFRNFYLGGVFRFRILGQTDTFEVFDIYSIPGYGRKFDRTIPALNLFIKYKLRL